MMDESLFNRIYKEIRERTYVCLFCGKVIFPDVSFSDEQVKIRNKYSQLKDNCYGENPRMKACSDCMERLFG